MKNTQTIEQQRENFKSWLAVMDLKLNKFVASFFEEEQLHLDYSPKSLDFVENWLIKHYATGDDLKAPDQVEIYDGSARYIGQTFLKAVGGYWELRLDDPKYAYYGLPQITGYAPRPTPECPHVLCTTLLHRRTGKYLNNLLNNMP